MGLSRCGGSLKVRPMAQRTTLEADRPTKSHKTNKRSANGSAPAAKAAALAERERVFEAFRRWGYLEAALDPLGFLKPMKSPDLDEFTGPDAEQARRIYSGAIGADFMHLLQPERRRWVARRVEGAAPGTERHTDLARLGLGGLFEPLLRA